MRYLIDIVHPAHVHFYRHLVGAATDSGHEVRVVARHKDVTLELLRRFGIAHETASQAAGRGRLGQVRELVSRDVALVRAIRAFRPHAVLTRSPAGVQAARLTRTLGIFDTDDGRAAGVHFRAAAPFAHYITTPDSIGEHYGARHVRYPSYKVLAYLHPARFVPDPGVVAELGVEEGAPYFLVRFVAMTASHDQGESGLPESARRAVVEGLAERGRVFVSSEAPLPPELEDYAFPLVPDRLHDAMAFAAAFVGDSQTMAAEAAVLGVPNVRCSSFVGRLGYLDELEHRYGLTRGFRPDQVERFMDAVDEIAKPKAQEAFSERRREMLAEKVDLTQWYIDFVESVASTRGRSS